MRGGVFRSSNNGDSWTPIGLMNQQYIYALITSNNGMLFAGTEGGIFRSLNNGDTWTSVNVGLDHDSAPQSTVDASDAVLYHWLWCLGGSKAHSIGTFNLATLFAAFTFCHIILASLVFLLLRSFGRAFDDPFVAVSRFFEAAANRLEGAQGNFFSQPRYCASTLLWAPFDCLKNHRAASIHLILP